MAQQKITSNEITSVSNTAIIGTTLPGAGQVNSTMTDVASANGTGSISVPAGTTEQRPGNPQLGYMRYNSDIGCLEQYNSSGWQGVAPAPVVTSFSGLINVDSDTTLTAIGSNFTSGSTISITGSATGNTTRTLVTTFVSSTQLTANTSASSSNYVGGTYYNVVVTNPTGLQSSLVNAGIVDRDTVWSTSAGNLGTIYDSSTYNDITLSASDPDGSVSYSLNSGSLPPGLTLNSANGHITGTSNTTVSSPTTYTQTVDAVSSGLSIPRTFNIIVNPARDGSSSARATTPYYLRNTLGITTNGTYWINTNGLGQTAAVQATVKFGLVDSKDWILMTWINQTGTQSGSLVGTDKLGNSVPWKGFCVDKDNSYYYSYFSSYQAYNSRSDTTASSGGNRSGYRAFLGNSGGMGWYNSAQSVCNWGDSSGSIGAGFDGSCGTYPTALRLGTGTGSAQYSLSTGQWKFWIWMDTAMPV